MLEQGARERDFIGMPLSHVGEISLVVRHPENGSQDHRDPARNTREPVNR